MIKLFESFSEIDSICKKYDIKDYVINSDGSIIVYDDVDLQLKNLKSLPLIFNRISGDFNCSSNKLTSLQGAPEKVYGYFYCQHNRITSLIGAPIEVTVDFFCVNNLLSSLEGCPQKVGRSFYCGNNVLTSLKGVPRKISGDFECQYNKIWTFDDVPEYVSGSFYCNGNPIYQIWKLFNDYSKMELFNYYDIIRKIDKEDRAKYGINRFDYDERYGIVLERLNDFLEEIGKEPVEKVERYINI